MDINVCRICCENIGITNIFDGSQGISISRKMMYCCASIQVLENDGLPFRVCNICEEELSLAYQFVLKCEAADKKIHSSNPLLSKQSVKTEIKVESSQFEINANLNNSYKNSTLITNQDKGFKLDEIVDVSIIKNPTIGKRKPKHKVGGQQKCKECGKQCINQSTLIIHMRKHSNDRPYSCESCDKRYKDGGGLKRHIERNHNCERKREFMCELCGKAFYSKYEVKMHMRTHTGETPYSCTSCPSKFTQAGALVRHQLRHTGEKAYSCSKCNKKFHTKVDLRRHEVAHTSEKKYICTTCNSPFKYANNLRKHVIQHNQVNKFICNYCGRTFNTKGSLKIHINTIHSGKSGFCDVCAKDVPNIEVHMWRHTGKRPLKCDICSSSFFEKKALTRHTNFKHKYSDKYKCSVDGCMRTFPSQPMLQYHVAKFHGSSIPFPCDLCSKGFYRKTDIARHKLRYHRET